MSDENLNAVVDNSAPAAAAPDTPTTPAGNEPPPVADPNAAPASGEPPKTETVAAEHPAEPKDTHDVRRMRRFMQEAAQAKAEAEAYKAMLAQVGQPANAQVDANEPVRENFSDDVAYTRALVNYNAQKIRQEIIEQNRNQTYQQSISAFQGKIIEARKNIPDIDIVLDSTVKQRPEVNDAMLTSPYAAEIAYELAKDDEAEAYRISQLPPHIATREIGKIEARIEARKAAPAPKPAASKAPAPIKPVGAQGGEEVEVDWSKKSDAEYFAHLRKKGQMPK